MDDGSSNWVPAIHMGDEGYSSWLPTLANSTPDYCEDLRSESVDKTIHAYPSAVTGKYEIMVLSHLLSGLLSSLQVTLLSQGSLSAL